MMYNDDIEMSVRSSHDDGDSDSDEEPNTLQNREMGDSSDEEADTEPKSSVKTRELEWDDSTLSY